MNTEGVMYVKLQKDSCFYYKCCWRTCLYFTLLI